MRRLLALGAFRFAVPFGVLAAPLFTLAGCDAAGLDDFEEQVAVSALLLADQPLPTVFLALTGPIGATYDADERAIVGAELTLARLAADGAVEATYAYVEVDSLPGRYYPADPLTLVRPEQRYRLKAVVAGFPEAVTAETTVPRAIEIVRPPPDTVVFQQGDSPGFDVTPSGDATRQAVYVFTTTALAPSADALTPFAADLFNNRDVDLEDLVATSSPLINEDNAEQNSDGTIRIRIPWFGFSFYGPNAAMLTAPDEALATFLEFQALQFAPTTISPGEIPNVPTNVVGGVGIVGAAAQATVVLYVARP